MSTLDVLKPPPLTDGPWNPTLNWRKEKRANETHESLADPEAPLFKKTRGGQAKLAFMGQVIAESRNGVLIDVRVTLATGTAERDAAIETLGQSR